ncbi:protein NRT1/ PTR FAMILY 4.5 [Selaginella moellendorffii]|uniref:protein NRT1/ PTR FAMILY 4.5 n=1 Tax=Selaginella moellendorffii TaxID=88036 RepID=UPI000D1CB0C9|nr:protein NRT1/ PTR FAMILY 4.5 [Selaginella moellendorffii]|eukprot:XP_024530848.1 protein NRT1/ PTR FAMILY 4.5 [Selaginella moellendorffii]
MLNKSQGDFHNLAEDQRQRASAGIAIDRTPWRSLLELGEWHPSSLAASFSIGINLFTFAFNTEHFSLATAANIVTNFMGTMFLLTLLGGLVADLWWSRFKTIVVSGVLEILGILLVALAASIKSLTPPECQLLDASCKSATSSQKAVFFGGLYLLALGAGGVKANIATMGAVHFDENSPVEKKELGTYFNTYFIHFCVGALIAITALVYTQENVSFEVGYLIALGCMVLGVIVAAAVINRLCNHGSFLDRAAIVDYNSPPTAQTSPWKLCTVTQVEEVKLILRILPIFASTIVLNCVIAQVQTVTLQQGRTMDRRITKSFEIPPASVAALPVVFMIIALPIYDRIFVPIARRVTGHENGITYLQRISVGLLLAIASMVVAALVEKKRIRVAREFGLLDSPTARVPLKIYWIMIQYFIIGLADMFTFVGLMEFFYREAPERVRNMSTALTFVSLSLGYFLSSTIVDIVKSVTTKGGGLGWLPSNINRGNISNFYLLLASVSAVNFVVYVACARWYRYRDHSDADSALDRDVELEDAPSKATDIGSVSKRPLMA